MIRNATPDGYEIIERTQHWRIVNGHYFRDCLARRADGTLWMIAVPDGRIGQ